MSSLTDDFANREAATISTRELDVDQRNMIALNGLVLQGARSKGQPAVIDFSAGKICTLLPEHLG